MLQSKNYESLFLAKALGHAPLFYRIGRQRESYLQEAIGEGLNNSLILDKFGQFNIRHLFLCGR